MKIHRDNVEHIKSSRANKKKKTFNIVENDLHKTRQFARSIEVLSAASRLKRPKWARNFLNSWSLENQHFSLPLRNGTKTFATVKFS